MRKGWALILLILLVACSPQGEESVKAIKIGFMGPLTGDVSVYGIPASEAVELAVEEVNAEGGVNGVPVTIVYEDTKCTGKEGVNAMNKLISVDGVQAIVGTLCSAVAMPTYPLAENAGVFMMGYGSSSPDLTPNTPYYFRTFPSDALQAKVSAQIAIDSGYKRIAVMNINDEYGIAFKNTYVKNIEEMSDGSVEIVTVETFNKADVDFKTQIQKIKDSNPDFIQLIVFPKEGGLILKQLEEAGINLPIMGTEASNDPMLVETAGDAAEGYRLTWPKASEGEVAQNYHDNYLVKFGKEPGAFGATAYDALHIIVNAMRECGTEGSQILECVQKMESHNGAAGTIVFDEFGDVIQEYDIYEVKNGKITLS